jgi:chromosome segregation ATPase
MVMSHETRTELYTRFSEFIQKEAVEEMLSEFPLREQDLPASKDYIEQRLAGLQVDLAATETRLTHTIHEEVNGQIGALRSELKSDIGRLDTKIDSLRTELKGELSGQIGALRTELKSDIATLDTKVDSLRTELKSDIATLDTKIDSLRTELKSDIGTLDTKVDSLRTELKGDIGTLDTKFDSLAVKMDAIRTEIDKKQTGLTRWAIALFVAMPSALLAGQALFR